MVVTALIAIFYYELSSRREEVRSSRAADFGISNAITGLSSKELDDGTSITILGTQHDSKVSIPKCSVSGDVVALFNKGGDVHYYKITNIEHIKTVNLLIDYTIYYFKYDHSESEGIGR